MLQVERSEMVLVPFKDLQELIHSTVKECITSHFSDKEKISHQIKPISVKYYTREEVKGMLGSTYVTLQKYTDAGLLTAKNFGRRVLYPADTLELELNTVKAILRKKT